MNDLKTHMGLFSFLRRKKSHVVTNEADFFGDGVSLFQSIKSRKTSDYYKSWVYACIRAISESISNIKLTVVETNQRTGEKEIVQDSKAMEVLLHPNLIMTKQTLFSRLQSHKELFGNEYWFIKKVGGVPEFIFPLRPEHTKPIRASKGFIKGYEFRVNGKTVKLDPDEVVHYKNFNPVSDIVGMSTLNAAQDAAATDVSAREYNQEFFDNGARPGVILESKVALDKKKKKEIIQQWSQMYAGQGKRYKTAIADGGLAIKDFNIPQKDMEFMEQRKFSRDEILSIFGTPKPIVSILEDVNRASAEAALFIFALLTIDPKMRAVVDTLNAFYLPLFPDTENQSFEFVSPVPKNKEALTKEYQAGIAGGWLTPNEVRAMEGLPPLVDGDQTFLPLNLAPFSKPKPQKAFEPPKTKAELAITGLTKALTGLMMPNKAEDPDDDDIKTPEVVLMSDEKEKLGEIKSAQERKRLLKQEAVYAKESQKLFNSQQRTATKNLVEAMKGTNAANFITKQNDDEEIKPEDVPELLDKKKEVAKTIAIFTPLMLTTIKIEGDVALDFVGSDETLALGGAPSRKFVNKHVKKFADETVDFTISELQREIAIGLTEGEAIPGLTKRIQEMTAFNKNRSEMIARTEVFRMKTQGEIEGWVKSRIVEAKIWYTALDERVCPACAALHGKEVKLRETFLNIGDTDAAGRIITYEPVIGAPEHPRCRCTLLPVTTSREATGLILTTEDKLELYNKLNDEEKDG